MEIVFFILALWALTAFLNMDAKWGIGLGFLFFALYQGSDWLVISALIFLLFLYELPKLARLVKR